MSPAPRLLVVADPHDAGSRRVAGLLTARHGAAARVLTATDLVFGGRVEYRSATGRASTRIALADGTAIDSHALDVVWFRAGVPSAPWAARASDADAAYAIAEAGALLLAWLGALPCPVVNAPAGGRLTGPAWTPTHWLALAARAGLPVMRTRATTDARGSIPARWLRTGSEAGSAAPVVPVGRAPARLREPTGAVALRVLVTAGSCPAVVPGPLRAGCEALARATRCGLLAVSFATAAAGLVVVDVDPVPALDDPAEVEAVAALMERLAASVPSA